MMSWSLWGQFGAPRWGHSWHGWVNGKWKLRSPPSHPPLSLGSTAAADGSGISHCLLGRQTFNKTEHNICPSAGLNPSTAKWTYWLLFISALWLAPFLSAFSGNGLAAWRTEGMMGDTDAYITKWKKGKGHIILDNAMGKPHFPPARCGWDHALPPEASLWGFLRCWHLSLDCGLWCQDFQVTMPAADYRTWTFKLGRSLSPLTSQSRMAGQKEWVSHPHDPR